MSLRLVYRSYGGENMKSRPAYYSKRLALASFLRAAEQAGLETIFLNDGPIPADRLAMMHGRGEVVDLPGGPVGLRKSYVAGLRLPRQRGWADDDVVYFSEDDYLHAEDAFIRLRDFAAAAPQAHYFALYGSTPRHVADVHATEGLRLPHGWRGRPSVRVGDGDWVNVPSTASTFGARVGALRDDYVIFRQCMVPYRRRFLDHETCLVYQGQTPFSGLDLFAGPEEEREHGATAALKNAFLVPFRLGLNAQAARRRRRPHLLYAADPNLACHLENDFMAPGTDWAAVARDTAAWARRSGHPLDLHEVG